MSALFSGIRRAACSTPLAMSTRPLISSPSKLGFYNAPGSNKEEAAITKVTRTPYSTEEPDKVAKVLGERGVCVVDDRSSTADMRDAFAPFFVGVDYPTLQRFGDVRVHQLTATFKLEKGGISHVSDHDFNFIKRSDPIYMQRACERIMEHLTLVGKERAAAATHARIAVISNLNPSYRHTAVDERRMHHDKGLSLWIRKGGDAGAPLGIRMGRPFRQCFQVDVTPGYNMSVVIDNAYGVHGNRYCLAPRSAAYTVTTELLTDRQFRAMGDRTNRLDTLFDFRPPIESK